MQILSNFCLVAILMASAIDAQTAARPGGRSLRIGELPQKPGAGRQLFVAPEVDHVFPYFLSSATWTTTFYLTNLEDREINVTCEFVGTNGEEKPFKFSFSGTDDPTGFTASKISRFATESFSTVSTAAALTTAWAYCASEPRTDRFSGYAIVRNTAANGTSRDFVTGLHPDSEPVFSVPFLDSAANTTGLVLMNSSLETDSSLALWMFDRDGKDAGNGTLVLKPGNLRVIVLNDAFKTVKSGTLRVTVVEGSKQITGMALRTNAAGYAVLAPLTPKEAPLAAPPN